MLESAANRAHLARLVLRLDDEIMNLTELVGESETARLERLRADLVDFVAMELTEILDRERAA